MLDIKLPRLPDAVLDEVPQVVRDYVVEMERVVAALVEQLEALGVKVDEAARAGKRQATPFRTDKKRRKKKRRNQDARADISRNVVVSQITLMRPMKLPTRNNAVAGAA